MNAEQIAQKIMASYMFEADDGMLFMEPNAEPAQPILGAIATALREARASGYAAAREQAAGEVERWSLPTIQTPSMWLVDKAGIAAAIRAMEAPDE